MDTNLIASNTELVISHLKARRADSKILDEILKIKSLRAERNACIQEGDKAKNIRKSLSKDIGLMMKQNKLVEVEQLKQRVEEANFASGEADEKLARIDAEIKSIFPMIPNLLDDRYVLLFSPRNIHMLYLMDMGHRRVPDGSSDAENPVVFVWNEDNRKIGEEYLWHDEIAKVLGGLDIEAASKVSGARFSVLVGPLAKLERALIQFFLDFHSSRGYTEVSVPFIVTRSTLEGTGACGLTF